MLDIRNLWDRAVHSADDRRYEAAIVGALDGTSVDVPGRVGYVYARRGPNGELGEVIAKNTKVHAVYDLPVKMRLEAGQWVIREAEGQFSDPDIDPGESGVYPHASTHQHSGTDEVATATPGANAIVKADADGKIGAGWIDDTDIDLDNVTEGTTNKFFTATEKTKLAGIEAGADVTDAGNVGAAIDASSTDDTIADTDTFGYTTGGTLKKTAWSVIKSTLKTYFDTLYTAINTAVLLTGNQTVAGDKTFSGATKMDGYVLISQSGSQDYRLGNDGGTAMVTQSQSSGVGYDSRHETIDADGTDAIIFSLWAIGKTGSTTNRLRMRFGWDATNEWFFLDNDYNGVYPAGHPSAGASIVGYPIILFTKNNANQLYLGADGKVIFGLSSAGATNVGIKAGASSNDAAVGGVLYSQPLSVSNTLTGEDDLLNFSLDANTLSANGMTLEIEGVFSQVNNANAKTMRLRFGSTLLTSASFPGGGSTSNVILRAKGMRTGATSQRWIISLNNGAESITTSAETLSGAVAIRFTGEGVATGDITLNQAQIIWRDANS